MCVCVGGYECMLRAESGWVGEYVEGGGGSIVVQFYLGGNVLEKFAICLLQCFFQWYIVIK